MSSIIEPLIKIIEQIASVVPLPFFVFFGAIIEEIVAPIPSPLVMTLAGSLATEQGNALSYLLLLALIGAVGKTLGSYVIYVLADKIEDLFLTRFGRLIGITHKEIEAIGKKLNQGSSDDIALFLLRAIPIVPTAPVSVVCGLIKLNLRTYLVSTFFGTFVRNMMYLYLGFSSVQALESINSGLSSWESIGYVIIAGILAILLGYAYRHRRKNSKQHEE